MSAIIRVKRPAQEGEVWPAVGGASPSCELELVFSENQQRRPNPRVLAGVGGEDVIMVLSLDYEPRTVDTVTTTGQSQS